MLSILNDLTVHTELQIFMTNNVFWTQQQLKNNPYRSQESNPGRSLKGYI